MLAALYQTRRLWENDVQKQCTYSVLYFMFCFNTFFRKRDIYMEATHSEHPTYNSSTYGSVSNNHVMMSHHDAM
jgi:hypothetical protein